MVRVLNGKIITWQRDYIMRRMRRNYIMKIK